MIHGHGDDAYRYQGIRYDFSSNVHQGFDHSALYAHLAKLLPALEHYPEPDAVSLETHIAEAHGLTPEHILATNGATEAIYLLAQAHSQARSFIAEPTFAEYRDACRMHGHTLVSHGEPCDLTWTCLPNNPTGRIASAYVPTGLHIVDASYCLYAPHFQTPQSPNLLTIRSMTKDYGVPGLRLGYIMGNPSLLAPLRALRMPWSIGALALAAGHFLLNHSADYVIPAHELHAEALRVGTILGAEPTDCHMLLIPVRRGTSAELKERLASEHGILVRDCSNFALTGQYIRVAVQGREANDALIKALIAYD